MFKGTQAKGGKRKGSGRKPKASTLLRRELAQHGVEEAQKSFDWLCNWRDDPDVPLAIRKECAVEIMNRVLGKPKQALELSGGDRPISIKTFDYASSIASIATGSSEDSDSSGEDKNNLDG